MIIIKNTENFAGVCISGDFNDLDKLVDAFYAITIDEYSEKNNCHIDI
jgi:20S proteasome alpha/beta subunit